LAEESGLIAGLGSLVLRKACNYAVKWGEAQFVSVNVSPVQLRSHGFADMVLQVLEQSGLAPQRLELEITETTLMAADRDVIRTNLSQLRERGIKIGLDDFGTGSSSLSHLIDFPVDRLLICSPAWDACRWNGGCLGYHFVGQCFGHRYDSGRRRNGRAT
jgi:EAL domain-containing protein (putative c-di-GMP-specific phosphodiesterase class I)